MGHAPTARLAFPAGAPGAGAAAAPPPPPPRRVFAATPGGSPAVAAAAEHAQAGAFGRTRQFFRRHGAKLALGALFGVLFVAALGSVAFIGPLGIILVAVVVSGAAAALSGV